MASTSPPKSDTAHTLTPEENEWCCNIKAACIAEKIDLPANDFLLAQFAIVSKGDCQKAIKRIKKYNEVVVQQYKYTSELGAKKVGFTNSLMPGVMQGVAGPLEETISETSGGVIVHHPTLAYNVEPYDPKLLKSKGIDGVTSTCQEFIAIMESLTADLDDVRAGCCMVQQAKGMSMKQMDIELEKKFSAIYQDSYPVRFHQMVLVEGGLVIRLCMKLMKLFLKRKLAQRIVLCSKSDALFETHGYKREHLPPVLGGTFEGSMEEFVRLGLERRKVSVEKLQIHPSRHARGTGDA